MGARKKISQIKKPKPDLLGKVKKFPSLPGVYVMNDRKGNVLYIGKAASLKRRVSSYFRKNIFSPNKELLIKKIYGIDFIICDSEAKALLLENSLIKEKRPKYNIVLRDDKTFPLVEISNEDFPCLRVTRKKKEGLIYFGPYPQGKLLKEALELIRKIFPFRTCVRMPKKECLYFHISLCPGPCIARVSKKDYAKTVRLLTCMLRSERREVIDSLRRQMHKAANELRFEEASLLKDKLTAVSSLYGIKKEFQEMLSLKQALGLKKIPARIEAIDISNITARQASGSVVVFRQGVPVKSEYRRYRIKTRVKDDLGMIAEVVGRRIERILSEGRSFSDLIVIDGGLTQVNTVKNKLREFKLDIPVIGISKKNEEIWFPNQNRPFKIPSGSGALRIIQRLRDEAHRFAHKYHLLLRKKDTYDR